MSFDPFNYLEPAPFDMSNGTDNRDPDTYLQIIKQFDLLNNARYRPKAGITWCNIFCWDVSRALAAEIPHWRFGQELNANALVDWLHNQGSIYGWANCDLHVAQANAQQGMPTIVTFKNPNGHGHIGFMLPNGNIAAAGLRCVFDEPIVNSFGNNTLEFWVHS